MGERQLDSVAASNRLDDSEASLVLAVLVAMVGTVLVGDVDDEVELSGIGL
jgi:hypothetical protein